jgi:hypothetical protein
MNFYLEYLTESDRNSTVFRGYRHEIENLENRKISNSRGELIYNLRQITSDCVSIIITIFSHSAIDYSDVGKEIHGLVLDRRKRDFISWRELIDVINSCRTKYPLTLNLLTPCNSKEILNDISSGDTIDRIWYSKVEGITVRYSILLAKEGKSFDDFRDEFLIDFEKDNYGEWVKP